MNESEIAQIIDAIKATNEMMVKTGCEMLVTRKDGIRVSISHSDVLNRWEIDTTIDDKHKS